MGLLLSILVVCVGVLEAVSCFRHIQDGYLPFWMPRRVRPMLAERVRRKPSVPDDASSSSEEEISKILVNNSRQEARGYGLTPIMTEHLRHTPIHFDDEDIKYVENNIDECIPNGNFTERFRPISPTDGVEVPDKLPDVPAEPRCVSDESSETVSELDENLALTYDDVQNNNHETTSRQPVELGSDPLTTNEQTCASVIEVAQPYLSEPILKQVTNVDAIATSTAIDAFTNNGGDACATQDETLYEIPSNRNEYVEDISTPATNHEQASNEIPFTLQESQNVPSNELQDKLGNERLCNIESPNLETSIVVNHSEVIRDVGHQQVALPAAVSQMETESDPSKHHRPLHFDLPPMPSTSSRPGTPSTPRKVKADISWPVFHPDAPVIKRPAVSIGLSKDESIDEDLLLDSDEESDDRLEVDKDEPRTKENFQTDISISEQEIATPYSLSFDNSSIPETSVPNLSTSVSSSIPSTSSFPSSQDLYPVTDSTVDDERISSRCEPEVTSDIPAQCAESSPRVSVKESEIVVIEDYFSNTSPVSEPHSTSRTEDTSAVSKTQGNSGTDDTSAASEPHSTSGTEDISAVSEACGTSEVTNEDDTSYICEVKASETTNEEDNSHANEVHDTSATTKVEYTPAVSEVNVASDATNQEDNSDSKAHVTSETTKIEDTPTVSEVNVTSKATELDECPAERLVSLRDILEPGAEDDVTTQVTASMTVETSPVCDPTVHVDPDKVTTQVTASMTVETPPGCVPTVSVDPDEVTTQDTASMKVEAPPGCDPVVSVDLDEVTTQVTASMTVETPPSCVPVVSVDPDEVTEDSESLSLGRDITSKESSIKRRKSYRDKKRGVTPKSSTESIAEDVSGRQKQLESTLTGVKEVPCIVESAVEIESTLGGVKEAPCIVESAVEIESSLTDVNEATCSVDSGLEAKNTLTSEEISVEVLASPILPESVANDGSNTEVPQESVKCPSQAVESSIVKDSTSPVVSVALGVEDTVASEVVAKDEEDDDEDYDEEPDVVVHRRESATEAISNKELVSVEVLKSTEAAVFATKSHHVAKKRLKKPARADSFEEATRNTQVSGGERVRQTDTSTQVSVGERVRQTDTNTQVAGGERVTHDTNTKVDRDDDDDDEEGSSVDETESTSLKQPVEGAFWLIFSGEYTKAMSKDWHSGHFCCWQCDESLTGQRYVLRDDHPYCIKCYESVFANMCEECNKTIGIDSKDLSYKDKHWHEACFLCNKCRVSLVDKQFGSKADKIYCGNCYDSQFASRCDGCGEIFRAGTKKMEYKTRQWHEKCFCCCVCKSAIGTKSFIPREQEIYCATCYEEKFATRCVKCNKIITSGGVTYKNEPWHRECFTCTHCSTSLAGQRFTSRDEKPYCAECFGELFAKRCTACVKPITGIGGTRFISFEDRHWHNDCFICASCKTSLVGRGFITDADDIICPECAKQKLM